MYFFVYEWSAPGGPKAFKVFSEAFMAPNGLTSFSWADPVNTSVFQRSLLSFLKMFPGQIRLGNIVKHNSSFGNSYT